MMKKTMAFLMFLLICCGMLVGCSSTDTPSATNTSSEASVSQDKSTAASEEDNTDGEVVTLTWVTISGEVPANYDAWIANLNKILEDEIGVNLEMDFGGSRKDVIISSAEYFDIMFTEPLGFLSEVNLGAYYNISDLLQTSSPELYELVPGSLWKAVKVDDGIYAVPTYKDSSRTMYMGWDQDIVDKYEIDYQNMKTLESMTDAMLRIKEGEGTSPFIIPAWGISTVPEYFDLLGLGLDAVGVRYEDETRTVVNTLDDEDVLKQYKTLHEWYNLGIINADAASLFNLPSYRMVFMEAGWPSAWSTAETTYVTSQVGRTVFSNSTIRGSLNAIYSGTKYPEKCLELLQLVNTNSKVRDAFYYGLEGENFKYEDDGRVTRLNADWTLPAYTIGSFFCISPLSDTETNQFDEVKAQNDSAFESVMLGFDVDASSIETEIAQCKATWSKYASEMVTGTKEPTGVIEVLKEELYESGLQKIIDEAQAQIDAHYKK